MPKRRDFLRLAALAALLPHGRAGAQVALPKPPAKKGEGIPVNDVHSHLSGARVFKIVEPKTADEVRNAFKQARSEEKTVCIAGGRHSMGGQPFGEDGFLLDIRKMNRILAFDTERGLLEV